MADYDLKDYLTIGGLGLGGLGLAAYSYLKQKEAGKEFAKALESVKKDAEINPEDYEKLREIAGVDVNIRDVNKTGEKFLGSSNAFFSPTRTGLEKNKNIISKVPGKDGLIALGSENRVLPTLAHELGHGKNSKEGRLGKRNMRSALWSGGGALAGLVSSSLGRRLVQAAVRSGSIRPEDAKWWALAPIAAGTALAGLGGYVGDTYRLSEEEEATKNAIKFLKAYGRLPKELRKDRNLLNRALETYRQGRRSTLLGTAALGLGSAAMGYGLTKYFFG